MSIAIPRGTKRKRDTLEMTTKAIYGDALLVHTMTLWNGGNPLGDTMVA